MSPITTTGLLRPPRLQNSVKEAVADGRVSEEERRVIWCVANQNNLLVMLQILCFVALFGFVVYYFDKVGLTLVSAFLVTLLDCSGQFH